VGTIVASCVAASLAWMAFSICRVGSSAFCAALRAALRSCSSWMYFFPASSCEEAAARQRQLWLQQMHDDYQVEEYQRQRQPQPQPPEPCSLEPQPGN